MSASTTRHDVWHILNTAGPYLQKVLLYGPPGTGKTEIAMRAGVPVGCPVYRVNMTEDTPSAELRGHYVPRGATWEWQDGPAMLAYRHGGRLVIDEITRAADDALSFTLAILDGHPITLPTGETVTQDSRFTVWATTNDSADALSDALADRFVIKVKADTINPEALATLGRPALEKIVKPETGTSDGVSFRQAAEYQRLQNLDGIRSLSARDGEDIAARLVWEARGRDISASLKLAEDV